MHNISLKIYDDKLLGVNITIDDKPIQSFLSFEERLNALIRANKQLDFDLSDVWSAFKCEPLGVYAWSITDEYYMHDSFRSGRKNTVLWYYYLLELIKVIDEKKGVGPVFVESIYIPEDVIEVLSQRFPIRRNFKQFIFSGLIGFVYFLKSFKEFCLFLLGFLYRKKIVGDGSVSVLIDMPDDMDDHRYGAYLSKVKKDYSPFFFNVKRGIIFKDNVKYRIISLLFLKDFILVIADVLRFKREVRMNRYEISNFNILFAKIKCSNYFFLIRNFLLIGALRKLFKKQSFDFVLVRSCFNDNLRKVLPLCSRENTVPCIYFLPRPLSIFRPAERIVKTDCFGIRNQILPDFYQIRDHHSYQVLISQGVNQDSIIESDRDVESLSNTESVPSVNELFYCSITVLLGGINSVNESLINLFTDKQFLNDDRILFSVRAHPVLPLTSNQKSKLSKQFSNWIDASKIPYKQIPAKYKIVVSSSSTATVEAAKSGCGVIWCPFIEEQSLLMYPVMDKFGKIAKNEMELELFLENIFHNEQVLNQFLDVCRYDANLAFSAEKSVEDGYDKLKVLADRYKKNPHHYAV